MALCRWTSECDLYIYESAEGIMCHVAANRYADGATTAAEANDASSLIPIGLPHDGEWKTFLEWADLLEYALLLKGTGYAVPDWVIEDIKEQMAADQAQEDQ